MSKQENDSLRGLQAQALLFGVKTELDRIFIIVEQVDRDITRMISELNSAKVLISSAAPPSTEPKFSKPGGRDSPLRSKRR